jgi:TolA-binding protein
MSYIYYEKKNWSRAKDLLTRIVQEHPDSSAAAQATKRLDTMRGEGH